MYNDNTEFDKLEQKLDRPENGDRAEVRRERKKRDNLSPANVLFNKIHYIRTLHTKQYFLLAKNMIPGYCSTILLVKGQMEYLL